MMKISKEGDRRTRRLARKKMKSRRKKEEDGD